MTQDPTPVRRSKRQRTLAPELFTPGTVFAVSDMIARMYKGQREFVATEVRRYGANSYVVHTTTPSSIPDHRVILHTSHIERIVSRGAAPLKIQYDLSEEQIQELVSDHERNQNTLSPHSGYGLRSSRTHYHWFHESTIVNLLVIKHLPAGPHQMDHSRVAQELMNQSFVHATDYLRNHPASCPEPWWFYSASKKRLDAWFRANRNRFLLDVHRAQRAEEEERRQMMEASFDRYLDDRDDQEIA